MKDQQCAGSEGMLTILPAVCDILGRAVYFSSRESVFVWTSRVQGADGTTAETGLDGKHCCMFLQVNQFYLYKSCLIEFKASHISKGKNEMF